ncbi:MAG: hypothetical protein Q8M74_02050 [Chloroflexota bacterium]|nr:hypothetical protein [Chloroflexota bacterium]
MRTLRTTTLAASALLLGGLGCANELDPDATRPGGGFDLPTLAHQTAALTAAQCEFFEVDGKVQICHFTGSPRKPYTIIGVNLAACVDGHAGHDHDYVAIDDPDCSRQGCFPARAPYDGSVECCDGLAPDASGICAPAVISGEPGELLAVAGISLVVPADAPTLTVRALDEAPPSHARNGATIVAVSPVYELGPAGTTFSAPLFVHFAVEGLTDLSVFWSDDGVAYDEVDAALANGVLTVATSHFSRPVVAGNPCKGKGASTVCGVSPDGVTPAPTCQPAGQGAGALKCLTPVCNPADHTTPADCGCPSVTCATNEVCEGGACVPEPACSFEDGFDSGLGDWGYRFESSSCCQAGTATWVNEDGNGMVKLAGPASSLPYIGLMRPMPLTSGDLELTAEVYQFSGNGTNWRHGLRLVGPTGWMTFHEANFENTWALLTSTGGGYRFRSNIDGTAGAEGVWTTLRLKRTGSTYEASFTRDGITRVVHTWTESGWSPTHMVVDGWNAGYAFDMRVDNVRFCGAGD